MANVAELKKAITAACHALTAVTDILADGTINLMDLPRAPALLGAFRDFTAVGYQDLIPEVTDLSKDELAELAAHVEDELKLSDAGLEEKVEIGLNLLWHVSDILLELKELAIVVKNKFVSDDSPAA